MPDPKVPLKVEISSRGCLGLRDTFLFARQIASAMVSSCIRMCVCACVYEHVCVSDSEAWSCTTFSIIFHSLKHCVAVCMTLVDRV